MTRGKLSLHLALSEDPRRQKTTLRNLPDRRAFSINITSRYSNSATDGKGKVLHHTGYNGTGCTSTAKSIES